MESLSYRLHICEWILPRQRVASLSGKAKAETGIKNQIYVPCILPRLSSRKKQGDLFLLLENFAFSLFKNNGSIQCSTRIFNYATPASAAFHQFLIVSVHINNIIRSKGTQAKSVLFCTEWYLFETLPVPRLP